MYKYVLIKLKALFYILICYFCPQTQLCCILNFWNFYYIWLKNLHCTSCLFTIVGYASLICTLTHSCFWSHRLAGPQQCYIWHGVGGGGGEDPDRLGGPDCGPVGRGEAGETGCLPGPHKLCPMRVCSTRQQWYSYQIYCYWMVEILLIRH